MSSPNEDILQELEVLVGEELQVVSFKWLSRRYGLQVNLAKQLLFAFVERHKSKVKATYLLAGWTRSEPSQHIVRLVDQEKLLKSRETLAPVTSLHVYSVQPTQPKDPAELWNVDNGQLSKLFDDMVKLSLDNCLVDNRWGAVACPDAKRDPKLATRPPVPARPSTAAPEKKSKGDKSSGGGIIAAIDAVGAGATNSRRGVAATSIAAGPGQTQASGATADEPDPDVAPAPSKGAPSSQAERKPSGGSKSGPASKPPSQPTRGKGKSQLANMWSKAPAKASKAAASSGDQHSDKQAPAGPADAEEALQQSRAAGSGSDSDDELPPVRQAFLQNGSQSRSAQQLEESDSEEEQPSRPAQPAVKTNAAAAGRSSKPAAPTRASGTSKPKPHAGSKALASAASEEASKGAPKRTASGKAHSQQQEPSGSTAGDSVAGGAAKRRRVVLEDESSDEDDEVTTGNHQDNAMDVDDSSAAPSAKGRQKGAGKAKSAGQAKKGKASKKGGADSSHPASDNEDIDVDIDDTGEGSSQQDGKRKRASQKEKPAQKLGTAKAGAEQGPGGRKRRKVPRSSYNEKGEEVTEMVWEEDPDEPELGTAGSADTSSAALKELSGNEGKTQSSGKAAHSALPPMKPAKESGASSGAVKKPPAKSGKAASKNQKGIMTFFGKK